MSLVDSNSPDLIFKTEADVKAFSTFFLHAHPYDSQSEFSSDEQYEDFLTVRERTLQAQLDYFRNIDFTRRPNVMSVREKYYKIAPNRYSNPLSSVGSTKKSSRFNYKNEHLLQNYVIYFGKSEACCEMERFHLDYQLELADSSANESLADELDIKFTPNEENIVYEYSVDVDKILVLTSKPSCDAIGISLGAYRNEWFEVNDLYDIPSASQILGSILKAQGYNGIMYTSVRSQATPNLVIFEENAGGLKYDEISKKKFVRTINR
ncbi:MAG: RES family NAD+ phosphorylase [Bacteriovoracaceae bacterium]|nr:RES family NAD+ phosphorylase [Bacteriovoracaceae bacterium]